MGVLGVPTGVAGQAHDGVAVDPDEALGLADAAAVAEVGEDGVLPDIEFVVEIRTPSLSRKSGHRVCRRNLDI